MNSNNNTFLIENSISNRIKGCLYGHAIGDALGLGSEFMSKATVQKYYPSGLTSYNQIIQDRHRKRWVKGAWTDDTDMMICLLKAFTKSGFVVSKAANNFKNWYNGTPMGIGRNTIKVLMCGDYIDNPFMVSKIIWECSRKSSAANGALMRTSVMGLWPVFNENWVKDACRLTHYDPRCQYSCLIVSYIIHNLVWNNSTPDYKEIYALALGLDKEAAEFVELAYGSKTIDCLHLDKQPGIGYTYRALSAALWCLWHAESFVDGLLKVVNEGGDADTNAAISCSILGGKFGFSSIPSEYIVNLYDKDRYQKYVSSYLNVIESSDLLKY